MTELLTILITIYATLLGPCPGYRFRITQVLQAPATVHVVTQAAAYDKPLTKQEGYIGWYWFGLPQGEEIQEVSAQVPEGWQGTFQQMSCKPTAVSLVSLDARQGDVLLLAAAYILAAVVLLSLCLLPLLPLHSKER